MKFKIFFFFSILSILIFLLFFSQKRNNNNKKLKINIDFKHENSKFLDSQIVNKLLIQWKDSTFNLEEDALDLKVVEDLLKSNPMVASAEEQARSRVKMTARNQLGYEARQFRNYIMRKSSVVFPVVPTK